MKSLRLCWLCWAACALWVSSAALASTERWEPLRPGAVPMVVKDLFYGDVLYEFYQEHPLDALTRILAYEQAGRMDGQRADADLMEAALWLQLGLHAQATEQLNRVLASPTSAFKKNQARLYLAQVWYVRGEDAKAQTLLEQMSGRLPADMEAERVQVLSNVLIRQGHYAAAASLLRSWHGFGELVSYARFNLGVALLRDGQLAAGKPILEELGHLRSAKPDLLELRDRANLALGFALLEANRPAEAKPLFLRVRLKSQFASRALLGSGWVLAKLKDTRGALSPWSALQAQPRVDTAVLEALLAVPRTYLSLGAPAQAAEQYERALQVLGDERGALNAALLRLAEPDFFKHIVQPIVENQDDGWLQALRAHPEMPESRYLYDVLASHDFQEGLTMYRELHYLDKTLGSWQPLVESNQAIMASREDALKDKAQVATALIDNQLGGAQMSAAAPVHATLSRAVADMQALNQGLALRVANASARHEDLRRQAGALQTRVLKVLADEASADLITQRERVDAYERQAVYELALIYDHASSTPRPSGHP